MIKKACPGLFAILLFPLVSHAHITLSSLDGNSCASIPGNWFGKGKATNWLIGTCTYHGDGAISALDNKGRFTITVSAHKDAGSFVCPKETTEQLSGICDNGVVTLQTAYGDIKGDFNTSSGTARGKLTVSAGIDAEIELSFYRK